MHNWIYKNCRRHIGVGDTDMLKHNIYASDRTDLYLEGTKCPLFGGTEFEDLERCCGCGEYFKSNELNEDLHCLECQIRGL